LRCALVPGRGFLIDDIAEGRRRDLEPTLHKVQVIYRPFKNLTTREAATVYVVATSAEDAESQAREIILAECSQEAYEMQALAEGTLTYVLYNRETGLFAEG